MSSSASKYECDDRVMVRVVIDRNMVARYQVTFSHTHSKEYFHYIENATKMPRQDSRYDKRPGVSSIRRDNENTEPGLEILQENCPSHLSHTNTISCCELLTFFYTCQLIPLPTASFLFSHKHKDSIPFAYSSPSSFTRCR
jgi:hypothetical protein